jgi:pimeloyl-ACP methyl ester carboxylesterase
VLAASAGVVYERIAEWRDLARFPPPGRLVDVGGFRLHLSCTGRGSPTVVLDTGLGLVSSSWAAVQRTVERTTRVCSYDRAGYAWSESGPAPRTSAVIASELRTLLARAGERGPFVLVGHSFGGYNIRLFAHQNRADVAGLVFVDSSHEDQVSRMPPRLRAAQERTDQMMLVLRLASETGVTRLFPDVFTFGDRLIGTLRTSAPDAVGPLMAFSVTPMLAQVAAAEMGSFEESARMVKAARDFGAMPLTVISAGRAESVVPGMGIAQEDVEAFQRIWVTELQADMSRLSTRGRQIVLEEATHMIPVWRPDAVTTAVEEMVRQLRQAAN